ncbi:hypothetical protein [Allobaculum stercoricanis]|uniref:hypothetical protein n=1 Tax=Allobaculum stercoricanis TaxID=174709 RepID=UPI00036F3D25|nr:hypothetical protein [Allobaculum stercoricanis]
MSKELNEVKIEDVKVKVLLDEEKVPTLETSKKQKSFGELLEQFWRLDEDLVEE